MRTAPRFGQAAGVMPLEQQPPLPLRMRAPHELGEVIASTMHCDVHAGDGAEIIKLYRRGVPRAEVEETARISIAVHEAGLAVPAVRPYLIECERSFGIVFDRVQGPSMLELNYQAPIRIAKYAAVMAEQHRAIHRNRELGGLRSQKKIIAGKLRSLRVVSEKERAFLLALLESLPDGNAVCHGDFHWENVILGPDAPVVIDWTDASLGNHLCDVARTWMILKFAGNMSWKVQAYCKFAAIFYTRSYFGKSSTDRREFSKWKLINTAARLSECLDPIERARVLRYTKRHLRRVVA